MIRTQSPVRPLLLGGLFAGLATFAQAGTFRIDFGIAAGNPAQGAPTASPDLNGNYWNNVNSTAVAADIAGGTGLRLANLVDTANVKSPVSITLSGGWKSSGIGNGGLTAPDPTLLGDMAIATATQDYYFVEGPGSKNVLTVSGLNPEKLYNFRFFGTRNTTDIRQTTYTLTAPGGSGSVPLQTSGAGSGSAGNGNDNTIVELNGVQADTASQVRLEVAVTGGNFAYLGIMEIIEAGAAPRLPSSRTVRVDFGRNNGIDGDPVTSPDSFGNRWNNLFSDFLVTPGQWKSGLVATDNTPTSIGVALSAGWKANGRANGGLFAPNGPTSALLADFAVEDATEDYYFVEGAAAKATLTLTGLNPAKRYNLRLFGTRNTNAEVRKTTYKSTASSGVQSAELQTSGNDIGSDGAYDGNDNTIVVLPEIQPDLSREILLEVSTTAGGFSYLGALEITESIATVPTLAATPPATEPTIVRWVQQDVLDPVAPGSLVFAGSSSIRRWEQLQRDFADYRITQRGYGGSLLDRLDDVSGYIVRPFKPSAIVIWSGTNDVKGAGQTGAQVNDNFRVFVGNVRSQQPNVPIFFLGITPTPAYALDAPADLRRKDANTQVKATCDADPTLHYVDLPSFFEDVQAVMPAEFQSYYSDDSHFSKKGYGVWKSILRPQLKAVIAPNKVFTPNVNAPAVGESTYFDFGPNDGTNGDATIGADARGHFWNNWHATNGGGTVNSGEHLANLVKADGSNSSLRMTITGGYLVNGKLNGGLFPPKGPTVPLLGDLAVATATQDYFFSNGDDLYNLGSDDVPGGFMIEGLNPSLSYELRIFGTRDTTETRVTRHAVFGLNTRTRNLQTSGVDIGSNGTYDGNDDEVAVITIVPDAFGQIFVDQTALVSQFAYIGAMEIKASTQLTAIDFWRIGEFTSADLNNPALEATLFGNNADPDSDGRNNLLEYATGTEAQISDADPTTGALEQVGPDQFLTLTYQKNQAATDISYQVEASDDLEFHENIADAFLSAAGGLEIRKASVPVTGFPKRFLRLKVEPTTILVD